MLSSSLLIGEGSRLMPNINIDDQCKQLLMKIWAVTQQYFDDLNFFDDT